MNDMMKKTALASVLALGFMACSEDPDNTNNTNPQIDMTPIDRDMDPKQEMGPGEEMGPDDDMDVVDNDYTDCAGANPSPRCAVTDPSTVMWAPASVVSKLQITSDVDVEITPAEGDPYTLPGCCYDYNGDEEMKVDNALGSTIASAGSLLMIDLDSINTTIAETIASGSVALVLEHEGVDPVKGGAFAINFMLGVNDAGEVGPVAGGPNNYKIDPVSFEQGVWPQARVSPASLTGTQVTGGPGVVAVSFALFGVTLNLRIIAARVEATVSEASANGVQLTNGKIGGLIRIEDLIGELNDFAATNCGCLETAPDTSLGATPLIGGNIADGFTCTSVTSDKCCTAVDAEGECTEEKTQLDGICSAVVGQCAGVAGLLPLLADTNSEDVGSDCGPQEDQVLCDSASVGLLFEAEPATITGVAAATAE